LKVSHNLLNGDLNLPSSLEIFSASSNLLSGTLPLSWSNNTQLQLLDLRKNGFTGELPTYLIKFNMLKVLSLGYNNLQGSVPEWITTFTSLQVLDLCNNNFNGRIPFNLERLKGFRVNSSSDLGIDVLYEDLTLQMKGS
jgi:Leucine-rich repeat (LRR) protein